MNWTKKDIEKLQQSKLSHLSKEKVMQCITSPKGKDNAAIAKKTGKPGKISVEKETIKRVLWVLNREGTIPDYVEELQFHPKRKWRFDWAIPALKIAVEYNGIMSKKSRHTTVTGYTNDMRKINAAQKLGWTVLQYTPINYNEFFEDIKDILSKK